MLYAILYNWCAGISRTIQAWRGRYQRQSGIWINYKICKYCKEKAWYVAHFNVTWCFLVSISLGFFFSLSCFFVVSCPKHCECSCVESPFCFALPLPRIVSIVCSCLVRHMVYSVDSQSARKVFDELPHRYVVCRITTTNSAILLLLVGLYITDRIVSWTFFCFRILVGCGFSGEIPAEIGKLSNLVFL